MTEVKEKGGETDRLLTAEDVAQRLKVSKQHVYNLAACGELPSIKLGGFRSAVRFDPKDVDRFIREHRRGKGKAA
jgi:excisionase family DNA binding protein